MTNHDHDAFSQDDQILPETIGEWEEDNKPGQSLLPDEVDEFFAQDDVGEQINAITQEVREGIGFDNVGMLRAQEHYREQRSKASRGSSKRLRFDRLEDRQGGDPFNQGEIFE